MISALVWLSALAAPASGQESSPCEPQGGLATGPAAISLWDGDLGRSRRACPRTELVAGPRALLLVDTPAFYGQIVASGQIEASIAPSDRSELWLRLEPIRYQNVISAIPASELGYGFTGVGLTHRLDGGGPSAVALVTELTLPSAIGLQGNALPFGLAAALALQHRYSDLLSTHGQLGYVWSTSFGHGPSQLRTGYVGSFGASLSPGRAFALALDAQAALAYTAPLDHIALAPALRFAAGRFGIELAASLPLLGRERALAAVELRSSWRL